MLELTSNGRPVQLSPGTQAQLQLHSPLFDEDVVRGEFSYSFDVPAAPNGPLYGYPERPDALGSPEPLAAELRESELELLTGTQTVSRATPARYTVSVQGGLGGTKLSERQLSSFAYGGVRTYPRQTRLSVGGNWPLLPGLVAHMNAVVATPDDYDYVFAPLRNEYLPDDTPQPYVPDPLDYPLATVNPWAAGTFVDAYAGPPLVLGLPPVVVLPQVGGFCPFPRLAYVLRAILEEAGFVVDPAEVLPGPLGSLVVAGNAQLVDRGDAVNGGFHLADVLPALTVAQLLAALRADLGVVVYVDRQTGRARTGYLHERLAAPAQELTAVCAGYPEASPGGQAPAGVTLTPHVDADDALTKDLLAQQPDAGLILAAVATVADLPAWVPLTDQPAAGQVRLVEDEGRYYACTLVVRDAVSVGLAWAPAGPALPAVPVAGGGEEQARQLCYTATRRTRYTTAGTTFACPAISQAPFRADLATVGRSSALRLLFYNGLQPGSDGTSPYPQLALRTADGQHSLHLHGAAGTYARLLRSWWALKLRPGSYRQGLALAPADLAGLDLTRPVALDGVEYLVRQLTCTVPLRKPATAELVRLW